MTKPIILRTDAELEMGQSVMSELTQVARVITAENDSGDLLQELARDADLLFTCYAPITAEVIHAARKLRGIVKYGVGVDRIDLSAATQRGIPVVHCPDYGTETVADHAFALLIAVARKLPLVDREMRRRGWLWPEPCYLGVELAGKTAGLIGYGRIGRAMARRCLGFGMRVLVYDPYVPREAEGLELRFCGLTEALRRADFVSLHCVLTPETRGLIGAEQLRRMKNSAFLINVSRGALVDEQALADALRQGQIAGAGLDVFEVEPLTRDHPLLEAENVVLSPHFAFYTREAYQRLERQCLAAIRELLEGRIPPHVKNTEILEPTPPVAVAPSSPAALPPQDLRMEGDVNRSSQRVAWQQAQLDSRTREVLAEDARFFMHQSLSTPCLNVLSSCRGSEMVDLQGRRILDFHGNSAHQVGYGHPRVIEAVKAQLDELPFCPRRYTNPPAIELAKTLASLAPGKLSKVLLTPSGTAAMGIALKLARYATRRHQTISMWGSFHGASLDAISIGGEALFRDGLGPLLPGCHHVPWPQREEDAELIERAFRDHGEVGAVIAEPMRCTTMERPPNGYWHRVRELCDHHGALLVFDEIPLALGRTGKMFCCEHAGVTPDILVIGKGLGGGVLPLAAVLARDDLDVVPDRALGHYTHEKSPVAAAAALATLQVLQEEDLLNRSQALGARALDALRDMQQRHRWVRDVRGLGLALGVELGVDELDGASQAEQVMYGCLARGLSFKVSGGNVLTLTPPLVISEDELNRALSILDEALAELV